MEQVMIFRAGLLLGFLFAAWRWGDWHNWRNYYPTILFTMLVNITASYLAYHQLLWVFTPDKGFATHTILNIFNTFTILPLTTLLFLSHLPRTTLLKKCRHIILWILLYSIIEAIDQQQGGITYLHGWSLWCSVLLNCTMFPILAIHRHHPVIAWLITFLVAWLVIINFNFFAAEIR